MEDKICPKATNCPLFNVKSIKIKKSVEIYKKIYCNNGLDGRKSCKRFLVSEKFGKPDDDLLPNDPRTADEIIRDMIDRLDSELEKGNN